MSGLLQFATNSVAPGTNISATFAQNCISTDVFIAIVYVGAPLASVGTFTLADTFNGTWQSFNTEVVAQDGTDHTLFIGYFPRQLSTGKPTINAAWDGGSFASRIIIQEVDTQLTTTVVDVASSNTWSLALST